MLSALGLRRLSDLRLLLKRPGVRSRMASYRLNSVEIARLSRLHWTEVRDDFAERMEAMAPAATNAARPEVVAVRDEPPAAGQRGRARGPRAVACGHSAALTD